MNKARLSNFELLRLLAMLFVLLMHAIFTSCPLPTKDSVSNDGFSEMMRMWVSGLTYVNVDVFVLISGWFGMKLSIKAFSNILFQCLFCAIVCIVGAYCFAPDVLSLPVIVKMLYPGQAWWFVSSYLGLMVISPMLNAFVEKAGERELRNYLLSFYLFQLIFGLLFLDSGNFKNGISILSLSFVYILGRYLRLFPCKLNQFNYRTDLFIYFLMGLVWALVHILCPIDSSSVHFNNVADKFRANSNPVVIVGATYLFLAFSKIKVSSGRLSTTINWFACSCFSIYLFHCNPITFPFFKDCMWSLFENHSGIIYVLFICFILLCITIACVLIDKARLLLWERLIKHLG